MLPPTGQPFVPFFRTDTLCNDEQTVRIIFILDVFQLGIVRTKKCILPVDLVQRRLIEIGTILRCEVVHLLDPNLQLVS